MDRPCRRRARLRLQARCSKGIITRRGRRRVFFLLLVAGMTLACGGVTPTPIAPTEAPTDIVVPGDTTRSIFYEGIERTYILHIPVGYDATQPVPLVLAFHGIGLNAEEMIRISGFSKQADISGFVVVYPNGTGEKQSWNGGHCCGEAARDNVDDVGFVRALIAELSSLINIDPGRIYVTGFSNGAIMAYRLACELSDRIAAIGPVGATQALEDMQACRPGRAVPVIHFHGTNDRLNPYEGGRTPGGVQFTSVDEAIRYWAERDGCPAEAQRTESPTIIHDVYAPCAQSTRVELYTIVNGEHAWPGGEAVSPQIGEPTMEISAAELIWEFFTGHPLP